MSIPDAIAADDADALDALLRAATIAQMGTPINVIQPMFYGLSVLDLSLIHTAAHCLDRVMQLPMVADWVMHHLDEGAYASGSAFLWQIVFDGPNPLEVAKLLEHYGAPLDWRVPSGHLQHRTMLHLIGWWALSCCRYIDCAGDKSSLTYDGVLDTTLTLCRLVVAAWEKLGESPFLGSQAQVVDSFASHPRLMPALRYLIA